MKKIAIAVVALALLAGGAYALFGSGLAGAASSKGNPTPTVPPTKAAEKVVSDAKVLPVRSAQLSLPAGTVADVLVAEGDRVQPGQTLVRLDSARLKVAVAQAEAALRRSQAQLEELKAGPRPQEVDSAKAALDAAQAQVARLTQGPRSQEISAAESNLAAAQANLQKVLQGPDQSLIIAARADLANAQANLTQAQAAYDQVSYRNDVGALPQSAALHQATNNHAAAQARLDDLLKGPSDAAIAAAQAQVDQAQAQLDSLKAPARQADLDAAQAEVRRAEAQLRLVEAGPRPQTIAAAEADVAAAQAALEQARVALAETELKAPFAGTIASLDVKVGEQVVPGAPIVKLADLSSWQIETTDLTELSVVQVREGSPATITFDAIPGLELPGKVVRIKPIGESQRGDITYTAIVKPDRLDERMYWNMTASVAIEKR